MKKNIRKALLCLMAFGMAAVSCTNKAPMNEQQSEKTATPAPDTALVAAAEKNIKAHQEDIDALWGMTIGEEKKIAHYALAVDDVFLSTEDGKEGLLLSFFKDMKDIDNFDGVPVCEGQTLTLQGEAVIVKEQDKSTYYIRDEYGGFSELFTMTEKDNKKSFVNDLGEAYDEKEALDFINKLSKTPAKSLSDIMVKWN